MDDLLSTAEAAKLLGCSPRTILWYYDHRGLPGREIGGAHLFLRADVENFVKPKRTGRPKGSKTAKPPAKPAKKKKGKDS
jgi:excisionase family DNA binding protein